MHDEVKDFFGEVRDHDPDLFARRRVLEIGSYDVNGSVREMFVDCDYIGLDWRPGPGVDAVSLAHEYEPADGFDLVISTVALEHDPYWEKTLWRAVDLLRKGGSMILVWASNWAEHEVACAPQPGYYGNRSLSEVARLVMGAAEFRCVLGETRGKDSMLFLKEKI